MALDRRSFIKRSAYASVLLNPTVRFLSRTMGLFPTDASALITLQCRIFRPADLLDLEISFIHLNPDHNELEHVRLLRPDGKGNPLMIVRLPQQHISERQIWLDQANYATSLQTQLPAGTALKSFVSGYSFLVFTVTGHELEFKPETLLNWNAKHFTLVNTLPGDTLPNLSGQAGYPVKAGMNSVYPFQGANGPLSLFELPYKIYLTPLSTEQPFRFLNNAPDRSGDTVALWGNQLSQDGSGAPSAFFKVTGYEANTINSVTDYIYDPDAKKNEWYLPAEGDRSLLTTQFLREKVHQVNAPFFRFSALGAMASLRYNEPTAAYQPGDIIEWKQDINLGRDDFVKVVTLGVILPFGFKCKHIRIGVRKIRNGMSYIEYKEFIEPIETVKTYFDPAKPGALNAATRQTPFSQIQIASKKFPPIYPATSLPAAEIIVGPLTQLAGAPYSDTRHTADPTPNANPIGAFWPKLNNNTAAGPAPNEELLNFDYLATDWSGAPVHFKAPMLFARDLLFSNVTDNAGKGLADVLSAYKQANNQVRRSIDLAGQKVAYYFDAAATQAKNAIASMETSTIEFVAAQLNDFTGDFPYYPQMDAALAYLPVIKEVLNNPQATLVRYSTPYINSALDTAAGNAEQILLDFATRATPADVTQPITYGTNKISGLFDNTLNQLAGAVNPDMVLQALSYADQAYGLYEGAMNLQRQLTKASLANIFAQAKLFGTILLTDLLSDTVLELTGYPLSTFQQLYDKVTHLPTAVQVSYNWKSPTGMLKDLPIPVTPVIINFYGSGTTLTLAYQQVIQLKNPQDSNYTFNTTVSNAGLGVGFSGGDFIRVNFDHITISSATGQKPAVTVGIRNVDFSGILQLLEELQEDLGTLGKGLSVDILSDKIALGYELAFPNITAGAFNLCNIKLSFDFQLYFQNDPISFGFYFSERADPFTLSIAIFGGRGYFGIAINADGIKEIDALLEFGGYLDLDLGVASGCAYLFAGIYYQVDSSGPDLYGYLTAGGSLDILGIITLSINFYLGLESHQSGTLTGTASVTVNISVLFFSTSVTLRVQKTISNGGLLSSGAARTKVSGGCNPPGEDADCQLADMLADTALIDAYSNAFN